MSHSVVSALEKYGLVWYLSGTISDLGTHKVRSIGLMEAWTGAVVITADRRRGRGGGVGGDI